MTIHPAGPEGIAWIEQHAPCTLGRHAQVLEARDVAGVIVGAVALDCFTANSAQMHVAIDRPMAIRKLRPAIFAYLFGDPPNGAGCSIALGTVRASNTKALIFDRKLGFKPLARIRDGWAKGEDILLLELRKEDYRG